MAAKAQTQQQRCALDGKQFSYFEAQESAGSKPLGTLYLQGARLNLELGAAGKNSQQFGLVMAADASSPSKETSSSRKMWYGSTAAHSKLAER